MLLRRRKHRTSKLRSFSITAISLLILACEVWYIDSLDANEMDSSRMAISDKFAAHDYLPVSYAVIVKETGGHKSRLFWSKGAMVNFAPKLEFGQNSQRRQQ